MELTIYQADAFTTQLFSGNPAAVIPLQQWLPDDTMQNIAAENNLSETVFFVPSGDAASDFDIRWFTPEVEINLCGHATLASAFILFSQLHFEKETIVFSSKSGLLKVVQQNDMLVLDFPSWKPLPKTDYPEMLSTALGQAFIVEVFQYRDLLVVLENEAAVVACEPDFTLLKKMGEKVIITAKGNDVDFVSRFFAPSAGVDEDPVTGSAHSQLIPFWSERLQKTDMAAKQLSKRGGTIYCKQVDENRVLIGGNCVLYMAGKCWI